MSNNFIDRGERFQISEKMEKDKITKIYDDLISKNNELKLSILKK